MASEGMVELGRVVRKHGSAAQQATLVHIATNSIEYHLQPGAAAGARCSVERLQCACATCVDKVMSLTHVASCPGVAATQHRQRLQQVVLDELSRASCAAIRAWQRANAHLELAELFRELIPAADVPAAASELASHSRAASLMCGAFTSREATAAARRMGCVSKDEVAEGQSLLRRVRLLCLDSFTSLYAGVR